MKNGKYDSRGGGEKYGGGYQGRKGQTHVNQARKRKQKRSEMDDEMDGMDVEQSIMNPRRKQGRQGQYTFGYEEDPYMSR